MGVTDGATVGGAAVGAAGGRMAGICGYAGGGGLRKGGGKDGGFLVEFPFLLYCGFLVDIFHM